MAYPPGIPILAPGEEITDEIIDYIQYSVEKGCSMQGMEDSTLQTLNVLRMYMSDLFNRSNIEGRKFLWNFGFQNFIHHM